MNRLKKKEISMAHIILAVGLCISFGANFTAWKISFDGFGVFTTSSLRCFIASVVIFIWAKASNVFLKIKKEYIKKIFLWTGIFLIQHSLIIFGVSKTPASRATLIINLQPFFVLLLTHFIVAKARIGFRRLIGIIIGFCGVLSLFVGKDNITDFAAGDILLITGTTLWAISVVYLKSFIRNISVLTATFYHVSLASLAFLVEAFIFDPVMFKAFSAPAVCSLLYQGVIPTALGLIGWNFLIKQHDVSMVQSFIFVMPLSGVFFGIMLLGEPWTLNIFSALILVTAGLFITHYKSV